MEDPLSIQEWMNTPDGCVSRHTDMPAQLQTTAKTLCWKYKQTALFERKKRGPILRQLPCHLPSDNLH